MAADPRTPSNPYSMSDRWSRKVSIDPSFLNILTSRVTSTPNTRSGRTPSLGEVAVGLQDNQVSPNHRSRSKWKAGLLVTGSRKGQSLTPRGGQANEIRGHSRERRGTLPAGLHLAVGGPKRCVCAFRVCLLLKLCLLLVVMVVVVLLLVVVVVIVVDVVVDGVGGDGHRCLCFWWR